METKKDVAVGGLMVVVAEVLLVLVLVVAIVASALASALALTSVSMPLDESRVQARSTRAIDAELISATVVAPAFTFTFTFAFAFTFALVVFEAAELLVSGAACSWCRNRCWWLLPYRRKEGRGDDGRDDDNGNDKDDVREPCRWRAEEKDSTTRGGCNSRRAVNARALRATADFGDFMVGFDLI